MALPGTRRTWALLPLPGNEALSAELAARLGWSAIELETREFPDGETYLRIAAPCEGRGVALLCTLDRPDRKHWSHRLWSALTAATQPLF